MMRMFFALAFAVLLSCPAPMQAQQNFLFGNSRKTQTSVREFRSQLTTQEVVRLQRALATLGYYHGPIDGLAAPDTWDAVIDWARDRGWEAPSTLRSAHVAALEKELAGRGAGAQNPDTQTSGASDPIVQRVQAGLAKLGYYNGPIDGRQSATTLSALAAWAHDRGWSAPKTIRQAHANDMEQEIASRPAAPPPQSPAQVNTAAGQSWAVSGSDKRASESCSSGKWGRQCISLACDVESGVVIDLSAFRDFEAERTEVTLRVDSGPTTSAIFDRVALGPVVEEETYSQLLQQMLSGRALTVTTSNSSVPFGLGGFAGEYQQVKNTCDTLLSRLRSGENPYPGRVKRLPDEVMVLAEDKGSWAAHENTDFAGADVRSGLKDPLLRGIDEGQCGRLCAETDICLAYTYNPMGGTCFLKSGPGRMTAFPGVKSSRFSGQKPGFFAPPTDGPGPVVDGSVRWQPNDNLAEYQQRVRNAARRLGGACEEEEAALAALAKQLQWSFTGGTSGRVGEVTQLEWAGNILGARIPAWIVVHSGQPARFSGKGHIALGPEAPNPFAIKAGQGETRALVALATRGAGTKGTIDILPLTAGPLQISVDLVGYVRGCDKEVVLKSGERSFDIAPSRAEIVLNTPDGRAAFRHVIDVPQISRRVFLNEKRFLLTDAESGTEIVERAGSNLQISPTQRFIAVDQDGRTDIIDMIDGKTAATIDSGVLRWGLGDSIVFTSGVPWGTVNLSSTFGNFIALQGQMTGPSCCTAERGSTRVGIDLENAAFSIWGNLGFRVGALQNPDYASVSDAQGGYSSEGGAMLAVNMNMFWSLGLVSPVSTARDFDIAGGFTSGAEWEDRNEKADNAEKPRPFDEQLTRVLGRVGLEARAVEAGEIKRLAEAGNSKPLKAILPEQLARLGIELDPMTDGEHLLQLGDQQTVYAGSFDERLERSKTAMEQMKADAKAAGWKTGWSLPEDETMENDCEHLMLGEGSAERRILLPRDVVEVAAVRTPAGAGWVARAECVAGATFGSLRPYNAIYYVDFAAPLKKGGKAVLSDESFFFENAARRLWYQHPFEIKANDALLVSYAPGNGVITVVDRQSRKFLWTGEGLPNGDLLADAW